MMVPYVDDCYEEDDLIDKKQIANLTIENRKLKSKRADQDEMRSIMAKQLHRRGKELMKERGKSSIKTYLKEVINYLKAFEQ